jgi:isopenicillin N synthase-like dioxygenase
MNALPIIDVSNLSAGDFQKRQQVGQALRKACLDKGFFYCTGHGIPQGLIDAVLAESKQFFGQTSSRKLKVDKVNSYCNRGYEHLGGQTLETGGLPDQKEGYYIGLELPADDPRVVARRFNRGPNLWPSDLPGFKPTMNAYFSAMQDLGERLMSGIALSLNIEESYFDGFKRDPIMLLRLLHYPPQRNDASAKEKGAGEPTDFGALTLLLQDDIGGLQVFDDSNKAWIDAPPIKGSFIINLGDMIARWTNDRYRSTMHRVINSSGKERYSVPFFYSGNPDILVECIPTCVELGGAPTYPPITIEEHYIAMYKKTYES